jgi:hypothetical protein
MRHSLPTFSSVISFELHIIDDIITPFDCFDILHESADDCVFEAHRRFLHAVTAPVNFVALHCAVEMRGRLQSPGLRHAPFSISISLLLFDYASIDLYFFTIEF